jgi:hypothetical protein
MFSRIRIPVGLALLLSLVTSATAFAKGGFSFITISGPNIKEVVRVTDTALTTDFFTFANFYEDKMDAPVSPGEGYEITRYYIDGKREIAFDSLHYYPEAGFVFYDGIVNGESEYDGKWYTANPEIKTVFENALIVQIKPVTSTSQPQSVKPIEQAQPIAPVPQAQPFTTIVAVTAGLAVILVFAYWRRKPSIQ